MMVQKSCEKPVDMETFPVFYMVLYHLLRLHPWCRGEFDIPTYALDSF